MQFENMDTKKTMAAAKKFLPHGYSKMIGDELGYSRATISNMLGGRSFNEELFNRITADAKKYKAMIDEAHEHLLVELDSKLP